MEHRLTWRTIPTELLACIAAHCDNCTLAALCLVQRAWRHEATTTLYSSIAFDIYGGDSAKDRRARALFRTLLNIPLRPRLVRALRVTIHAGDPELQVLFAHVLEHMPNLRDLRIAGAGINHALCFPLVRLLKSRALVLNTLHIPTFYACPPLMDALFAQRDSLHVLGLLGKVEPGNDAVWSLLREAAAIGCGVFSYEFAPDLLSLLCFYPALYPRDAWASYLAAVKRSRMDALARTPDIELFLADAEDIPVAIQTLASVLPATRNLILRLAKKTPPDPDIVSASLGRLRRLQTLHFRSWGGVVEGGSCMSPEVRVAIAEKTCAAGCSELAHMHFWSDVVDRSENGQWTCASWSASAAVTVGRWPPI